MRRPDTAPVVNIVILALALAKGPVTLEDLCQQEDLEGPDVAHALEYLQGKQAVVRTDDEVEITEKGRELAWDVVERS